jgi:prophage regulatory protein
MSSDFVTAAQAHRPKRGQVKHQPLQAAQIADALLTMRTACAVAGFSETSIRRKVASDPTFPKLIRLGARCTRIRAGDLMSWLAAQATAEG